MLKEEDKMPDVWPFRFYVEAFRELHSCRINGMDMGPIPFSEIYQYAKIYGVEDFEEFLYIMRQMDGELMRLNSRKASKDGKVTSSKRNQSKGRRSGRKRP